MKTLAFFSPLSPLKGGVAHYADKLARELAKQYLITFYIEDGYTPTAIENVGEIRSHRLFKGTEDVALYQASNNGPLNGYMYPHILKHGGVVTLHDATLHDMAMIYWEGKSRIAFWTDFFRNEGISGALKVVEPLPERGGSFSQRILETLYLSESEKRLAFPFLRRVARRASGVITHSRWVADAARNAGAACPIMTIPLAVESAPPHIPPSEARKKLKLDERGFGAEAFVVLVYGYIQKHKRVEPILDAWAKFIVENPNARLMLVGPRSADLDIDREVAKRNLQQSVFIDGEFVGMEKVWLYVYASDLCLNLRKPVYGSSSHSLMQILSAGKACVVTNAETFAELPNSIARKISDGQTETDEILESLRWAKNNPRERESLGVRARQYVESNCLWNEIGQKYIGFLDGKY